MRIRLLAEQMIRLAGKQPGRDIVIVYTGLRPGEKMHETLFYADENYRPTAHPNILEADVRAFPKSKCCSQWCVYVRRCNITTLSRLSRCLVC